MEKVRFKVTGPDAQPKAQNADDDEITSTGSAIVDKALSDLIDWEATDQAGAETAAKAVSDAWAKIKSGAGKQDQQPATKTQRTQSGLEWARSRLLGGSE